MRQLGQLVVGEPLQLAQQSLLPSVASRQASQLLQLAGNAVARLVVRFEIALTARQQITALPGFGVLDTR